MSEEKKVIRFQDLSINLKVLIALYGAWAVWKIMVIIAVIIIHVYGAR